jgi:hypothetical protein
MEKTISKELLDKIIEALKKKPDPEIYWDYRDEISSETIGKALAYAEKHPDEKAINYIYDHVSENYDLTYSIEIEHIKDVLEDFEDEIQEELSEDEELDLEELARDMRDDLLDYVSVDYNLKSLLGRNNVNVRIEMFSNYDCINSHWLESQSPYGMDSYFGDVVRMLKFDPAEMKRQLLQRGYKTYGRWPKKDGSKQLVSYEDFFVEDENRSCGANLLTFIGQVSQYDFLSNYHKAATLIIPKGNKCGFYSSMQGGGSMLDMALLHDFEISLSKKYDRSGYLNFGLFVDGDRQHGYDIKDVYGVSDSFFDGEIIIKK